MIIKVPFGRGGVGRTAGTEHAPDMIVNEFLDGPLTHAGKRSHPDVLGLVLNQGNHTESHDAIQKAAEAAKEPFVAIGGDHSITYPLVKGFIANNKNNNAGLLVLDAHPDCMQPFQPATHENFLRMLIEEGVVDAKRVVIFGLRAIDEEELRFLKQHNITHFPASLAVEESIEDATNAIMAAVKDWPVLYVSVDIDVADPSCAPGTGYAEPGGISAAELLYMIRRLCFLKNIASADIVEVNPSKDINNMTVALAARVLAEIAVRLR